MEIKTQLDLYAEIYRIIKENKPIEDKINIKWVRVDDIIKWLNNNQIDSPYSDFPVIESISLVRELSQLKGD